VKIGMKLLKIENRLKQQTEENQINSKVWTFLLWVLKQMSVCGGNLVF